MTSVHPVGWNILRAPNCSKIFGCKVQSSQWTLVQRVWSTEQLVSCLKTLLQVCWEQQHNLPLGPYTSVLTAPSSLKATWFRLRAPGSVTMTTATVCCAAAGKGISASLPTSMLSQAAVSAAPFSWVISGSTSASNANACLQSTS